MRRGMYVQYSTLEKAVIVGTVDTYCTYDERRYPRGMHVGHGKMFPKFLMLMLEICLDFVKLCCDDNKRSLMRLKMTYTQHDQISK